MPRMYEYNSAFESEPHCGVHPVSTERVVHEVSMALRLVAREEVAARAPWKLCRGACGIACKHFDAASAPLSHLGQTSV